VDKDSLLHILNITKVTVLISLFTFSPIQLPSDDILRSASHVSSNLFSYPKTEQIEASHFIPEFTSTPSPH